MPRTNSDTDPVTQKSKFVSYLLRHDTRVGDLVDERGFASLKQLNSVARKDNHRLLTEEDLIAVAENSRTKRRFEYEYRPLSREHSSPKYENDHHQNEQKMIYIRALNGHSFPLRTNDFERFVVDENAADAAKPKYLYHATNASTVPVILAEGLKPMSRQFVHMYEFENQVKYDGKRNTLLMIGPITGNSQLELYRSKNGYIQCPHVIPADLVKRKTNSAAQNKITATAPL